MSDLLLPVSIYFIDSILSCIYMQDFLKGKVPKEGCSDILVYGLLLDSDCDI